MGKGKPQGVCCICGKNGDLSFEHVPPQAAYNKTTVIEYEWQQYFQNRKSKGKSRQRGAGAYTLCEKCNNDTGRWYGNEYVKWARTCYDIMLHWNTRNITYGSVFLWNVHPLRFLKQVVTCFFSVIGTATFANNNLALAKFVLEKENTTLPSGFRFFVNLYNYADLGNTSLRRSPLAGKISIQMDSEGNLVPSDASIFSENAHPPFQLVMTQYDDPFDGATEITDFAKCGYDDQLNLRIDLRVVSSESPYPGAG